MKKLLLTTILILTHAGLFAQSDSMYNFSLLNNRVVWRKIFQVEKTSEEIRAFFTNPTWSGQNGVRWSDNAVNSSGSLHGGAYNRMLDYRSIGHKWGSSPANLNFPCDYEVVIDIKDGRYRVTILDMKWYIRLSGYSSTATLDEYAMNRKKTRWRYDFFTTNFAEIINDIMINTFTIKDLYEDDTDW